MLPPVPTRYEELINELKETTYDSLWNKELGKTRDYLSGLPMGVNPETVTYGMAPPEGIKLIHNKLYIHLLLSTIETPLKDVLNPPKTRYEVLYDSQVGHELYKKTHNDYNPGEQVSRKCV